ncbi:hypothetical protein BKA70DRAFT_1242385 [Coprinopsis sp. MPI-PUGE-AT-0042]|nr:hypothetical protein BKA70DRAFT_1242385 [Coprinopsis sp. MPI-PUGE-AT-0042]
MSTSRSAQNTRASPRKETNVEEPNKSDESDLDDFNLDSDDEQEESGRLLPTSRMPRSSSEKMDVVNEQMWQSTGAGPNGSQTHKRHEEQQEMQSSGIGPQMVTKEYRICDQALVEVRQARDHGIVRYTAAVEQKMRLETCATCAMRMVNEDECCVPLTNSSQSNVLNTSETQRETVVPANRTLTRNGEGIYHHHKEAQVIAFGNYPAAKLSYDVGCRYQKRSTP